MLRNMNLHSLLLIFIFSLCFNSFCHANDQYRLFETATPPYLEICGNKICRKIFLPETDTKDVYFDVPAFSLLDIDADGIPELIVTEVGLDGAVVNVRSLLFRINNKNVFEMVYSDSKEYDGIYLYNITFYNGKVVSSYRERASWYDDIFVYLHGKLILEMRDINGFIRTVFDQNGMVIDSYLINNEDKRWYERERQTARITSPKAVLYNSPNLHDISKIYLVKGDSVNLIYSSGEGIIFYLAEYTTEKNKKIRKWIKKDALELVK